MRAIRGSEYQDFLRCRLRWDYAWNKKLRPKRQNEKLAFGTVFHLYLELLYATGKHDLSMFEWEQDRELLEGVATHYYATTYQEHMKRFNVLKTEFQFEVKGLAGTIDLIMQEKLTGHIYFVDHKTTSSIDKYVKNSELDRQISRYWWALQQLGYDVKGFIYNIILKDMPEYPTMLKNGTPSKAKSQNTTYELYHKYLVDNKLNISDYSEILDYLKDFPKQYFKQLEVFRSQNEIDNAIEEFFATASDMENVRIYRNITSDCHWDCAYKDLCHVAINGGNEQYLLDTLYDVVD